MDKYKEVSLLQDGDKIEQKWWTKLKPNVPSYEVVWRMHVVPLRSPGSILMRAGIDEDLEMFAMNHYTAFVNLARALEKIEIKIDDLKFPEEIWSNLQRAIEVTIKDKKAVWRFSKVYQDCMGKEANIDIRKLHKADKAVSRYRNRLHEALLGSLTNEHGDDRLIPKMSKLTKYERWTKVMYEYDLSDFVTVESLLRQHFSQTCEALQDLWTQIDGLSEDLVTNEKYKARSSAPMLQVTVPFGSTHLGSMTNPYSVSGSTGILIINQDSTSRSISASDTYPLGFTSDPPE
jgi:hypothetical protein